ncbi:transposase [Chryseobacterium indologenes]|uniref:transposase n=1 Tax=Chryseobacterium indologenes TaxID=253 RepID=UPI00405A2F98
MVHDIKNIHMGDLITQRIKEYKIDSSRICKFMKCTDKELTRILSQKSIESDLILRFSILLEYDFFRIYSHYLILYAPPAKVKNTTVNTESTLPQFRKKLYTQEIISFVLNQIDSGKKSKKEVINEYKIPKTTLYKWIIKYKNGVN